MVLAGILLKLGYYGFIRFFYFFFPFANIFFFPLAYTVAMLGIIYGALLAFVQIDFKKIIAYSSISHMNLCLLDIFFDFTNFSGSYLLALGHGIVSPALFFLVGQLYERYHSRLTFYYSGLNYLIPLYSSIFFYFVISNFSFPVALNFVGELLIFIKIVNLTFLNIFLLLVYSFLSVVYNLVLFTKIFFGQINCLIFKNKKANSDLTFRELFVLFPLLLVSFFGCFFSNNIIFLISY
jgi:NADH:ubiquinone oxidoreductase subunit 4 (subunit M)